MMKALYIVIAAVSLGYWVQAAPGSAKHPQVTASHTTQQAPRTAPRYALPCKPEGCGQPSDLDMAWTKFKRTTRDAGRDFSADMRQINRDFQRQIGR